MTEKSKNILLLGGGFGLGALASLIGFVTILFYVQSQREYGPPIYRNYGYEREIPLTLLESDTRGSKIWVKLKNESKDSVVRVHGKIRIFDKSGDLIDMATLADELGKVEPDSIEEFIFGVYSTSGLLTEAPENYDIHYLSGFEEDPK